MPGQSIPHTHAFILQEVNKRTPNGPRPTCMSQNIYHLSRQGNTYIVKEITAKRITCGSTDSRSTISVATPALVMPWAMVCRGKQTEAPEL